MAAPRPDLTALARLYGSDKGDAKHRYTQLYHMLFAPLRDRPLRLAEIGLQIGGPEHGNPAGRATTDAPSVRMWLDYFPAATISGLDVSDFAWLRHDRFRFMRCDLDDPAQIARAADWLGEQDIVIDDASHASPHQQQALAALFPRLAPGGLYVVEDLRWQPAHYERPGWPRTAELFAGYLQTGAFDHPDPAMQAALARLAPDIAGCFLFPVRFIPGRRPQVLVLHKRDSADAAGGP
jgi:hypothetical protein